MKISFLSRPVGSGLFLALAAAALAQPSPRDPSRVGPRADDRSYERMEGDRVQTMSGNRIEADERIRGDVKAVMGSNTVLGFVSHDVVSVMGDDTIDGSVEHDVTANMGSVIVNGTVGHNVKAVMGNVTLGPNAVVRGDVICVGGTVHRAPGAIVRGRIISQAYTMRGQSWGPDIFWNHDQGRSDWAEIFHSFLVAWRWALTVILLAFYALLALVFPGAVRRCGDVLVQRPAFTVLAALAALLAVPLVFVLLLITIIGIPVAVLLLPCGILLCSMFGKAGTYGLIGRSLTRDRLNPAGAVLLGGAVCAVFLVQPILGLVLGIFFSVLGFGCGITALLTYSRGAPPPAPMPQGAEPPAPAPSAVSSAVAATPAPPPPAQPLSAMPPPSAISDPAPGAAAAGPSSAAAPTFQAALPRAGFWIRMGALFIDAIIIGAACGSLFTPHPIINMPGIHVDGLNFGTLLPLAIYGALMWKWKGTTIGGMICGLRVVRLDDRPIEWETAIVRALACFLSTVLFLGFFWIAFDAEKQAWHDKIAGTVVVRTKGIALV